MPKGVIQRIKLSDGVKAKIGDTILVKSGHSAFPAEVEKIEWGSTADPFTGIKTRKLLVNGKWSPNECFASVKIANDKSVVVGDAVWVWRKMVNPALVYKIVVNIYHFPNNVPTYVYSERRRIQLAYEDEIQSPYAEKPIDCYATEQEALDARPDLAAKLENCLMRSGRRQGPRQQQVVRRAA